MSIIKELSTPNEVVEYIQNYLGNNQSALSFAKFYISKKSYLFNRSKQENAEVLFKIYYCILIYLSSFLRERNYSNSLSRQNQRITNVKLAFGTKKTKTVATVRLLQGPSLINQHSIRISLVKPIRRNPTLNQSPKINKINQKLRQSLIALLTM